MFFKIWDDAIKVSALPWYVMPWRWRFFLNNTTSFPATRQELMMLIMMSTMTMTTTTTTTMMMMIMTMMMVMMIYLTSALWPQPRFLKTKQNLKTTLALLFYSNNHGHYTSYKISGCGLCFLCFEIYGPIWTKPFHAVLLKWTMPVSRRLTL